MVEVSSTTSVGAARGPSRPASELAAVLPPLTCAVGHALALGVGLWLLGGGSAEPRFLSRLAPPALDASRAAALAGCGAVLLLRTRFWVLGHGRQPISWREALRTLAVAAAFQVGLPAAALGAHRPFGGWWDEAGLLLFLLGSGLSMGADLARSRAFAATGGRSGWCTSGPFAFVRHPTFLGDLGWGVGWALLTHSPWALLLPAALAVHFASITADEVERVFERQDPAGFRAWARRTSRLVPFVY